MSVIKQKPLLRCRKCNQPTAPKEFALQWNRPKTKRIRALCKLCVSIEANRSIRYNKRLPVYQKEIRALNIRQLNEDIEWLKTKLECLYAEVKGRESC